MSALLKYSVNISLTPEIEQHPAWMGYVSGLKAEKILRQFNTPYLYILRAGEHKGDYYVTFINPNVKHDNKVEHRPFIITTSPEGWCYENSGTGGIYIDCTIDHVIHAIMHCEEGECVPFIENKCL